MAGATFNFSVPALQLKGRFIVIEISDGPILETMTARTIGATVLLKLPAMYRFMAAGTCRRQAAEALGVAGAAFLHALMAGTAFLPGVSPLQLKSCQPVVKVVF